MINGRPLERVGADKAGMLGLPPVVLGLGWRDHVRLGRDSYVSVDWQQLLRRPDRIGRFVDIT